MAKTVDRMHAPVCDASWDRRAEHSVAVLFLNGESGELGLRLEVARSGAVCLYVKLSMKTKASWGSPKSSSFIWRKWVFA